ncbi:spore coat protein [Brevibacillus fluminis]|uniref:Spore coat protein n=1 Tax=Brevibacillus fluminis TaxID=511487 RepID=A0A3M8DJG0_9BACL|nr:spore coat protein [Brevibacillus fluminis]RNB87749.1 spore coat protein [Brevibacillus fluminis]
MNTLLEFMTGMDMMTDQVIAMDFLITAKSGVRNYAMAVTEVISPDVKATLTKQLEEAIDTHEQIMAYVMERGLYHPWNVSEQIQLDLQNIDIALKAPVM